MAAVTNTMLGKGMCGIVFQWIIVAFLTAFMFLPSRLQAVTLRPLAVAAAFVCIPFIFVQTGESQ